MFDGKVIFAMTSDFLADQENLVFTYVAKISVTLDWNILTSFCFHDNNTERHFI